MASASITKPVRALLDDMEGFNISFKDQLNPSTKRGVVSHKTQGERTEDRIGMKLVEVDGFHKALPNVKHIMVDVKGKDKMAAIGDILLSRKAKSSRTMIFCNTIDSCRALSHHLEMSTIIDIPHHLFASYHGDLKSEDRGKNLLDFRKGHCQYLICTDIAARGLDIPSVDHVVMFDFPLNPIDYLHRSGRTGRAGRPGRVTALVAKRDIVLARAIQSSISKNLPLDSLTSSKKDYIDKGKLASVVGRTVLTNNKSVNDKYGLKAKTVASIRRRPRKIAASDPTSNSKRRSTTKSSDKKLADKKLTAKQRIFQKKVIAKTIEKVRTYNSKNIAPRRGRRSNMYKAH